MASKTTVSNHQSKITMAIQSCPRVPHISWTPWGTVCFMACLVGNQEKERKKKRFEKVWKFQKCRSSSWGICFWRAAGIAHQIVTKKPQVRIGGYCCIVWGNWLQEWVCSCAWCHDQINVRGDDSKGRSITCPWQDSLGCENQLCVVLIEIIVGKPDEYLTVIRKEMAASPLSASGRSVLSCLFVAQGLSSRAVAIC